MESEPFNCYLVLYRAISSDNHRHVLKRLQGVARVVAAMPELIATSHVLFACRNVGRKGLKVSISEFQTAPF